MAVISKILRTSEQEQPDDRKSFIRHTILAMRRQEKSGFYNVGHYLGLPECQPTSSGLTNGGSEPLDSHYRQEMTLWCIQMCDRAKIKREIALIAISYWDRFLGTPSGRVCLSNRPFFKLVCTACLNIAIKMHSDEGLTPQVSSDLSGVGFDSEQIEKAELLILDCLDWKMNAPTVEKFIHNLVRLIPARVLSDTGRQLLIDLAEHRIHVAINWYWFALVDASTMALATLASSLDCIGLEPFELRVDLLHELAEAAQVDIDTEMFVLILDRLDLVVYGVKHGPCSQLSLDSDFHEENRRASKPATSSPLRSLLSRFRWKK